MSFLHDAVLPGPNSFHNNHGGDPVTTPVRRLRKSQSTGSLLSPLVHLVRNPVSSIGDLLGSLREDVSPEGAAIEDRKRILYHRMKEAESYEEWRTSACELDTIEGNEEWKKDNASPEYDVALVQTRLTQLEEARINCDVSRMLFLIRTSLRRGLGGMGGLRLYKHSHIGTKALIEQYIESTKLTIETLLELSEKQRGMDPRYILEQLLAARQAFGRSALLLSGGGTFGMNHIGVVKALWEAKLLPRIVSGSSAGSIVCAVLCTKTDTEMPEVIKEFCYGDLAVFDKEGEEEGVLPKAARFLKYGYIFDIAHLVRVMRNMLGEITFQEAYNRTRRILNISVSSASIHEMPRLLNYITAPNVMIWSAVAASCSVPIIFSAAQLLAKDPSTGEVVDWNPSPQQWIDGSVDNDLPMTRLAEMFNVNHFIVSQVNPHVIPFLSKEEDLIAAQAEKSTGAVAAGPGWLHTMANLAKGEALHRLQVAAEMGIFPNYFTKAQSVLSQKYSGDITILPEISYANFPKILTNPNTEFMIQAQLSGERATWPKLSRVQNHCAIELALDAATQKFRSRIAFSPSQVDLRLSTINVRANGNRSGNNLRGRATRLQRNRSSHSHNPSYPTQRPLSWLEIQQKNASSLEPPQKFRRGASEHYSTPDLLSSDTDDEPGPGLFTDDVSDSTESYTSESPPASPVLPTLWPSTRQLFPYASQPSTPYYSSRFTTDGIARNPASPGQSHNGNSQSSLTMTRAVPKTTVNTDSPSVIPSSPERKYKSLFHGPTRSSVSPSSTKTGAMNDSYGGDNRGRRGSIRNSLDEARGADGRKEGLVPSLVLDISGTRGMMLRRKRSMSTGTRGIMPPGRQ